MAEEFYHAVGNQDGARACGLMTAALQSSIASGAPDCATATSTRSGSIAAAERDRLTRLVVDPTAIEVNGASATVPASAMSSGNARSSETGALRIAREGTAWKVDGVQ